MRYYLIKNWMKIMLVLGFIASLMSISVYMYTTKEEPTKPSDGLVLVTMKAADKLFDNGLIADSLDTYQGIQKYISPGTQPDIYGYVKIKEGQCYAKYAEHADTEANIKRAINCYKEASQISVSSGNPLNFAMAQRHLGDAYELQSRYSEEETNLTAALRSYDESLTVYTMADHALEYGLISYRKGTIYLALSKYHNENLSRSLVSYKEALKALHTEKNPFECALIYAGIGTVYHMLGMGSPTKENFDEAIASFETSLKIGALGEHSPECVMVMNNLASAQYSLSQIDNPKVHLKSAISTIRTELDGLATSTKPNGQEKMYATLQANLGAAYHRLSCYYDTLGNLEKSIRAYREALSVYAGREYPDEYRMMQREIGIVYSELAHIVPRVRYLKGAITAYGEVIKTSTYKPFPLLIMKFDGYNQTPPDRQIGNGKDGGSVAPDVIISTTQTDNNVKERSAERASSGKNKAVSPESKNRNSNGRHRYHTVRKGENTYRIALRYGLTLDGLCSLNNMMPRDIVRPGQKLVVR